jgi:hypothetical protein
MAKHPPDDLAIDIAYRSLDTTKTLEQVKTDPALRRLLYSRALKHMRHRARFDPKRLQANDNDD